MKAYELIKKPKNWCKGISWKDKDGKYVKMSDAYSFCAMGAIYFVYHENMSQYQLMSGKLRSFLNGIGIAPWNDNSDHETVYKTLKMLDI